MVEFLHHLQEKDISIKMQPLSQHVYTTNKVLDWDSVLSGYTSLYLYSELGDLGQVSSFMA